MSAFLIVAVGIPTLAYILLSLDPVQSHIKGIAEKELSSSLGARVAIEKLHLRPLNRVMLSNVAIADSLGVDTMATITRISAGIELWKLIRDGKIVVDYALLDGLDLHLWRVDDNTQLNIQPIIDHLRSDNRQAQSSFEIQINTVVVRRASARYDVLSDMTVPDSLFDAHHIGITDLSLNAYIPEISNHGIQVDIDHLSAKERCGFQLRRLSAHLSLQDSLLSIANLHIDLQQSRLAFDSLSVFLSGDIRHSLQQHPLQIKIRPGSVICPADFNRFTPTNITINDIFDLQADITFDARSLTTRTVSLNTVESSHGNLSLDGTFSLQGLDTLSNFSYDIPSLNIRVDASYLSSLPSDLFPAKVATLISHFGATALSLSAHGTQHNGVFTVESRGDNGTLLSDGTYRRQGRSTLFDANLTMEEFDVSSIFPNAGVEHISAVADADGQFGEGFIGNAHADIASVEWKGYRYQGIKVRGNAADKDHIEAFIDINDPNATAKVYAFYDKADEMPTVNATASLANINLSELKLPDPKPGYHAGAKVIVCASGNCVDSIQGDLSITDLHWLDDHNHGLRIPRILVTASQASPESSLTIDCDLLSGGIYGRYNISSLPQQLQQIAAHFFPAIFKPVSADGEKVQAKGNDLAVNNFTYNFILNSTEDICRFFEMPTAIVYPATIKGSVNTAMGQASVELDAPYILQGNKIYQSNIVSAQMNTVAGQSTAYLTTRFPTNKGDMMLAGTLNGANNRIDTKIDWTIDRQIPLNGEIDFSTELRGLAPTNAGWLLPIDATISFNPSSINFGYENWNIRPARITNDADGITIDDFQLSSGRQHMAIDGKVSFSNADSISVSLENVQLLPIFETLEIDKAMLSGSASGTFKGTSLLSNDRFLECPNLHVDSIGYNRCTIGDAEVLARWDRDKQSFFLDADITGDDNRHSTIRGDIFPMAESLDLSFHADSVPVGFLKPFMEAFSSDISGRASGDCRLFGTFKEIDLTGDVFGHNVSLAVDFTNTVYTTTDSVHMRPGRIIVPAATMWDSEGNTAVIEGWVNHIFFKRPSYRFDVTKANNLLSYNISSRQNPDWYGTIYGNGKASVYGKPGVVNIDAEMATAPRSTFAFVLTDRLDAADYSFLEFRDVTPDSLRHTYQRTDDEPLLVQHLRQRLKNSDEDEPSDYNMRLSVDVTPDAELTLVMDEVAGDEIKTKGEGHVNMTYNSTDEDLRLYGAYSIESGSYHFTLQDIIIKDFVLKEGSTINFDGDPYAMRADLNAYYATTANLSDLDESFLQDRDVARTKVPVHALMKVKGDIRQPDISFDLEFPTLTDDTYRKVRSIVSTNDMMNKQIIYLLALNRFYTPDYMSTTKGSELFSVASSTLSSQLSSLLGKLSDNWSIAPNLRSDRGDFSDVEVDVALSSRLLNNRLLFNGNFGYRDKSLNTNRFVGDFDIEYLLNAKGTWRLKAYNRYNDANYYLRSAATTQGVGIMYRRDFDTFFPFLHKKK